MQQNLLVRQRALNTLALALVILGGALLAACGAPQLAADTGTATPETPVLDAALAAAWPLEAGATWRYQVCVEEPEGNEVSKEIVTEQVAAVEQQDAATIVTVDRWSSTQSSRLFYAVLGNALYQTPPELEGAEAQQLLATLGRGQNEWQPEYVFPLEVGAAFGAVGTPTPDHGYEWFVEAREAVQVPAGQLEDCYRLVLRTNSGEALRWFCPGVGLARARYSIQGNRHVEEWELVSYPGQ
ncbi:MAG: hypothetical protein PHY79_12340 [Anaerolineae bacterium]|nr:hypothetical protein [Anaerolineae bacterium]